MDALASMVYECNLDIGKHRMSLYHELHKIEIKQKITEIARI